MNRPTRIPEYLTASDDFVPRHLGPSADEQAAMLAALGFVSLDALTDATVPEGIRLRRPLALGERLPLGEHEMIEELKNLAADNQVLRSFIGMGYYDTIMPAVILRNVLENPGWYTAYTPYQAEISQGRLEALVNFQTMVADLTALPLANASLLDEGTAAAEAMHMCVAVADGKRMVFWADAASHPQTLAVLATRCEPIGVALKIGDRAAILAGLGPDVAGVLLSYPTTDGTVTDDRSLIWAIHEAGAKVAVATDLLALTLFVPPGELGADIAVGSAQRFGVPMGFGGPHAAFMAAKDDFRRIMPGRIIGVSRDAKGRPAFRLALQTREQHIRREKATSNICTAQVLLAVIASMYGVYHGPEGLVRIARRAHGMAAMIASGLGKLGVTPRSGVYFDTLRIDLDPHRAAQVIAAAAERGINLRRYDDGVGIACDETTSITDVHDVLEAFVAPGELPFAVDELAASVPEPVLPDGLRRTSTFLTHPTFHVHRSEHEMLRYLTRLERKDLSLTTSMIPLGSCTMKLNATTEMLPVTWPELGRLHPYAPAPQWGGYKALFEQLEAWLAEITGFPAVSLQPNSGAQGEYAGLLAIRGYHVAKGQGHRTVCLIPTSAHGTNPASAVMAGMQVVTVASAPDGTIDLRDLEAKAAQHADRLSALMVTYPSTHGVFEEGIKEVCAIVHRHGGRVYMDGANMNAQIGLTRPAECGADVCHLNLHKSFCVSAGTPVGLTTGVARPIEQMTPGRTVHAWSDDDRGVRGANLDAAYLTGRKACVQVTMQDGRTITCTPDHRILTTDGWVEAGKLEVGRHRVVAGPELPVDDPLADTDAERLYRRNFGGLELAMESRADRDRTLAFFRLLGAVCSDGTYSQRATGRGTISLTLGTRYDAERALADIELLSGLRPTISRARATYVVRFPTALTAAVAAVPGIGEPGPRVTSDRVLPDIVDDPATPRALLREFIGALFGGDGCAPVIVHLRANPSTLKPVKYVQSRVDASVLEALQRQLCAALGRLDVEAMPDRIVQPRAQRGKDAKERPRWMGGVTIVDNLAFAQRVGFRYCAHKAARLSAATAFWRMKQTAKTQRLEVAERALALGAAAGGHRGPVPVWKTAVAEAYAEVAAAQPIVSPYYASFAGTAHVSRQCLRMAIAGAMGTRRDIRGLRRTHRRVLAAPAGRGGADTGVPSVIDFFAEIGATHWFNAHHARGERYSVTYATASQEVTVEPTFSLAVTDVRAAGEHIVYDLTVDKLHSFLANGVVVHNCIPHGGGGPGMGPIACVADLAPYLPGHPLAPVGSQQVGPVSAAPWGSASILPISFSYIAMMGADGLRKATQVAILGANYIAHRLAPHFPVLFTGRNGRVAHELILDCRMFKKTAAIEAEDIAKRLMDYGYHAPTMSFPVPGTLMIEPTESESKAELDRFCEAMIAIRGEIRAIEDGKMDRVNNALKNAPHTAQVVAGTEWDRPYTREQAAFPAPWLRDHKYWPPVARVDNAYGDRNLVCTCPPMEDYE